MHTSDKSITALKQTHKGLCQGQTPFFIKFGAFNGSLTVAPMNQQHMKPEGSSERAWSGDLKAVLWGLPRWSRATWGERQGQRRALAPMLTTAALLSFSLQFEQRFHLKKTTNHFLVFWLRSSVKKITPGLKEHIFKKPMDGSNSVLVMEKLNAREVLPLVKQRLSRHNWDKNRSCASCASYSLKWFQTFNIPMKSGSRPPFMWVPPPSTVILPLVLGSYGLVGFFCLFISWNRVPYFRCFSGYVMISPPQDIKQCQPHTRTTHVLAPQRHSPNAAAAASVISYPRAPRRIWEPTQGREGHRLEREKEKDTSAQLQAGSQSLKTR